MKKVFAAICAGALALSVVGCGSSALYTPGTYTGEGQGMSGKISVTLTVDENAITSVDEITDPGETDGIGGKEAIADGTFADQIIAAQSSEIDGVSGATITSTGVQDAVAAALEEAKVQ